MPDIRCEVPIKAPPDDVFRGVSTPGGLNAWWTKTASGEPKEGAEYVLGFGPEYQWRARVTKCVPSAEFELTMHDSHEDWDGTRIRFRLEAQGDNTRLVFRHEGWPSANEHWQVSCYCWPIYLRLLRRYLEHGEVVAYERRLDV